MNTLPPAVYHIITLTLSAALVACAGGHPPPPVNGTQAPAAEFLAATDAGARWELDLRDLTLTTPAGWAAPVKPRRLLDDLRQDEYPRGAAHFTSDLRKQVEEAHRSNGVLLFPDHFLRDVSPQSLLCAFQLDHQPCAALLHGSRLAIYMLRNGEIVPLVIRNVRYDLAVASFNTDLPTANKRREGWPGENTYFPDKILACVNGWVCILIGDRLAVYPPSPQGIRQFSVRTIRWDFAVAATLQPEPGAAPQTFQGLRLRMDLWTRGKELCIVIRDSLPDQRTACLSISVDELKLVYHGY